MRTPPQAGKEPDVKAFAALLHGFGVQNSHLDDNWLYLPRAMTEILGPLLGHRWMACPWDCNRLILFLSSHWDSFWATIQSAYQTDPHEVAKLRRRAKLVTYRDQRHGPDNQYVRRYWAIPYDLVKALEVSIGVAACQISAGEFWLEVTAGRSFGHIPLLPLILVRG
jgi:hypothetical protein